MTYFRFLPRTLLCLTTLAIACGDDDATPDSGPPPAPTTLCTNTCGPAGSPGEWAGDGACDDGGEGAMFNECALGTDCMDCGERVVQVDAGVNSGDAGSDAGQVDPGTLSCSSVRWCSDNEGHVEFGDPPTLSGGTIAEGTYVPVSDGNGIVWVFRGDRYLRLNGTFGDSSLSTYSVSGNLLSYNGVADCRTDGTETASDSSGSYEFWVDGDLLHTVFVTSSGSGSYSVHRRTSGSLCDTTSDYECRVTNCGVCRERRNADSIECN